MPNTETKAFENSGGSSVWVQVADASHRNVELINSNYIDLIDGIYVGEGDPNTASSDNIAVLDGSPRRFVYDARTPVWYKIKAGKTAYVLRGIGSCFASLDTD